MRALTSFKPSLRVKFLKDCDDDIIIAIAEVALNILNGNLKLNNKQLQKLGVHKLALRKLANKNQSVKSKRKILVQSGGALFLPTILSTLLASGIAKLLG